MTKKILSILGFVLLATVLVIWGLHIFVKHTIHTQIKELNGAKVQITYEDLELNLLTSVMELRNCTIKLPDSPSQNRIEFQTDLLTIKDWSYSGYFSKDELRIGELIVSNNLLCYQNSSADTPNKKKTENSEEFMPIRIDKLKILHTTTFLQSSSGPLTLSMADSSFMLEAISITNKTVRNTLPFAYDNFQGEIDHLWYNMSNYEDLLVRTITFSKSSWTVTKLNLHTKYTKVALSPQLQSERDHIKFTIPKIYTTDPKINIDEGRLSIKMDSILIENPVGTFYRDKLVEDALDEKPLYSKLLRNLSADVQLNAIKIIDGYASYEEQIDQEVQSERIYFNKINALLENVQNVNDTVQTLITATAQIMHSGSIKLDWAFKVGDPTDAFTTKGVLLDFNAANLNPFLKSNLRATAKGSIQEMYFTTYGNNLKAKGEMKMKYNNFEFVVLKKDRLYINKFITKLGNLFVKGDSKSMSTGYRYGEVNVERDPTKSFFNYLWLQVRDGLLDVVTGNGQK